MIKAGMPFAGLYTLTGETLNEPLRRGMKNLGISPDRKRIQKQRIDMAHEGRRLDYLPTRADLRWWFAEHINDGNLDQAIAGIDIEKVYESSFLAGSFEKPFIAEPIPTVVEQEVWTGPAISYRNGGYPGSTRRIVLKTPIGTVSAAESYAGRSFGVSEYPVKSIDDLKVVLYIYEQYARQNDLESGSLWVPLTPFQNLMVHLAGVQAGSYLLSDDRDEVEYFMHALDDLQTPILQRAAREHDVLFSCENFTSDVSTGFFEAYLQEQLSKRSHIAANHGKLYGVHLDGKIMPLLSLLADAGVGIVNGLTAFPAGDLDPLLIRQAAGPGMVLIDMIPQCIFMEEYDLNAFIDYIETISSFYKDDNRIIFGIGDMMPISCDMNRFVTMLDIIRKNTNSKRRIFGH